MSWDVVLIRTKTNKEKIEDIKNVDFFKLNL